MKAVNQGTQAKVDARYQIMLVLWFAFLSTIAIYFVVAQFIVQPALETLPNRMLTVVLAALGTFMVVVSVVVKQKFLAQSVVQQQPGLVQTGLIVALAMCEAGALLGLVDLFVTGNRYYFIVLIIAALGIVFHFPRRNHLLAASYKNSADLR